MAPSSNNQDAEDREFERVRSKPFERISGQPTWQQYKKLKQQAARIAVATEVEYDWAISDDGHKYGLLADILGGEEYEETTGISAALYDPSLAKPDAYDEEITSRTTTHI